MSKRSSILYINDIAQAIDKIDKFAGKISYEKFCRDEKTMDAVVRNLEIIGEAAKHVSKTIRERNKDIPWSEMVSMRNKVTHEYFGVDMEILWKTITEDLPELKKKIKKLI
ncbi:MAG: DUF86 domain-containing protein [Patescibacteria group bacterium]